MQPGPPYPPQQPPMGPPYQGQRYPGPLPQGQQYPGQQGFPQGYPPQFPGPAGPRKPRTGLIVLIVVLVVVVVGGGTTALVLLTGKGGNASNATGPASAPTPSSSSAPAPAPDRYQKVIANCTQLNGGPFTFIPKDPAMSQGQIVGGECAGSTQSNGEEIGVGVEFMIFNTPNGVEAAAQSASQYGGRQVGGTGFENAPYVSFNGECVIDYSRSNEAIKLQFVSLPGVGDAASCKNVGLPYAEQYYKLIG